MPDSTKKPTREQLLQFVEQVARLELEFAVDTADTILVERMIAEARKIVGGDFCDAGGAISGDLVECPDEKICQECLYSLPA